MSGLHVFINCMINYKYFEGFFVVFNIQQAQEDLEQQRYFIIMQISFIIVSKMSRIIALKIFAQGKERKKEKRKEKKVKEQKEKEF